MSGPEASKPVRQAHPEGVGGAEPERTPCPPVEDPITNLVDFRRSTTTSRFDRDVGRPRLHRRLLAPSVPTVRSSGFVQGPISNDRSTWRGRKLANCRLAQERSTTTLSWCSSRDPANLLQYDRFGIRLPVQDSGTQVWILKKMETKALEISGSGQDRRRQFRPVLSSYHGQYAIADPGCSEIDHVDLQDQLIAEDIVGTAAGSASIDYSIQGM